MKTWRDLSESERIERLGEAVGLLLHRMNRIEPVQYMAGYELLNIAPSMEAQDDYLPVYGGNVSKKE